MTMSVTEAVDRILLEQGEYRPIELLLALGYIDHGHYLEWQRGERETLDDTLTAPAAAVAILLQQAAAWVSKLGLNAEVEEFRSWRAGQGLQAFSSGTLNSLVGIRFTHPSKRLQLDLFFDGAGVAARNTLIDALLAGDASSAQSALGRLQTLEPPYLLLQESRALIEVLTLEPPRTKEAGLSMLANLQRRWRPAAVLVLGARSRDFLVPVWRSIGRALEAAPFNAQFPDQHATYAHMQGLAWDDVRRSARLAIERASEPVMMERLAEAEWRLGNRIEALWLWFRLCWWQPPAYMPVENKTLDWSMKRAWHDFIGLDAELAIAWFPAFMLCEERGLSRALPAAPGVSDPEVAFNVMRALFGSPQDEIPLRRQLRELCPPLLARYLARAERDTIVGR